MISFLNFRILFLLPVLFAGAASAAIEDNHNYAAIMVDTKNDVVIYKKHSDEPRYPASLTKLMTIYLVFDALKKGELKKDNMLLVSEKAAAQPRTNIELKEGEKISVEDCVVALVVKSANDCAVVLAQAMQSSEMQFSLLMTRKAREIGLKNTVFVNASGLPDKRNHTTARDILKLAIALKNDFPEYYGYFNETKFYRTFNEYNSHNRITTCYKGAEGSKTGFINDSGYNVVSSVNKDGRNIIAVVMGGKTSLERDKHIVALFDKVFQGENISAVSEGFEETCNSLKEQDETSLNFNNLNLNSKEYSFITHAGFI